MRLENKISCFLPDIWIITLKAFSFRFGKIVYFTPLHNHRYARIDNKQIKRIGFYRWKQKHVTSISSDARNSNIVRIIRISYS